jgi:L-alanine-DL-glutamate epimerase-like enolase superfamily enzyme
VYKENGVVEVPEAIGLGATISEEWLGKWEKVSVGQLN